jgi:tetratricopeptide (TPR) repeat protein
MEQAAAGTSELPLAYYYLAQLAERLGHDQKAADFRNIAAEMKTDRVFPFQWEAIHVLRRAMELNPKDANAPYILGNLLYDWQPEEATRLWEKSVAVDSSNPMIHRNLAVAYSHRGTNSDPARAIAQLELAVAAPTKYAMHFTELDELYAERGKAPDQRLALLEQNHAVVSKRDDALSREIGLKVFAGKYDEAIRLMTGRKFSVWEGGTLDVSEHWVNAHILRGRQRLVERKFSDALADFQASKNMPDNLPSDQSRGGHNAEIAYWTGVAYERMSDVAKAKESWQEAANAAAPGFRRGPGGRFADRPAQNYYQALAKRKLGQAAEADTAFRNLLASANRTLEQSAGDSSESFNDRVSPSIRAARAHYAAGLGQLGLGDTAKAKAEFTSALQAQPDFLGAKAELGAMR